MLKVEMYIVCSVELPEVGMHMHVPAKFLFAYTISTAK